MAASSKSRRVGAAKAAKAATGAWGPMSRTEFVVRVAGSTRKAAALLDVDASQTSRWASGKTVPAPDQARMLVDIEHVLTHVMLVWADEEVAFDWLTTPNANLDGSKPLDWIRREGTSEVVKALRAEAAGAYA